MTNPNYKSYYARLRDMTEAALEAYFAPDAKMPEVLRKAMAYSALGGGKRLRAVLLLAGCEMVGGRAQEALPPACALEMIHAYSLIHDDLPAMDDDDMRRGKPSNHKVFGEAMAILAGDGLLSYAMEILFDYACASGNADACWEIARGAGVFGMVAGQTLDVLLEGERGDMAQLEYIHANKTAAMIRGAVCCGLRVGGASREQLRAGDAYALQLGLAFQATDDLLDVEGDPVELGKPVGSDREKDKLTLPALVGLGETRARVARQIADAKDSLKKFGEAGWFYAAIADQVQTRKK